jgi:hypothetical protein
VLLVEPNGAVHGMERRDANLVSQPVTVRSASGQRRRTDQLPFPIITWNHFAHEFVKDHPGGMAWPGIGYEIRDLEVLVPVPDVSTLEELRGHELRYEPNAYRDIDRIRKDQQYFYAIHFRSAGWPHRIEEGVADKPGALWLTPTAEAVGKVKQALAEIDQANLEATQPAEKAKSNAEKKPDSAADQKAQSEPTEKKESDTENKANGPE